MSEYGYLQKIDGCIFEEDKDLSDYSTMKLVASGSLVTVKNTNALKKVILALRERKIKYHVLGWGANQILPRKSDRVYIRPEFSFDKDYLNQVHDKYVLPASVPLYLLSAHAVRFGIKGWEAFTGIPATLGGAIFMNAGTSLGEIGQLVEMVEVMDINGETRKVYPDESFFSYRKNHFLNLGDIITEATLRHFGQSKFVSKKIREYLDYRTKTQPLNEDTSGCIFKNYQYPKEKGGGRFCAGAFLDIMGLKGLQLGGVKIDRKHANFMINQGGASADEVKRLIEIVKDELMLQSGLEFGLEVKCPQ